MYNTKVKVYRYIINRVKVIITFNLSFKRFNLMLNFKYLNYYKFYYKEILCNVTSSLWISILPSGNWLPLGWLAMATWTRSARTMRTYRRISYQTTARVPLDGSSVYISSWPSFAASRLARCSMREDLDFWFYWAAYYWWPALCSWEYVHVCTVLFP